MGCGFTVVRCETFCEIASKFKRDIRWATVSNLAKNFVSGGRARRHEWSTSDVSSPAEAVAAKV